MRLPTTNRPRPKRRSKGPARIAKSDISAFRKKVWDFYEHNGRSFPWREDPSPYAVLVSEIMLQQTQTERVREKFISFMRRFPAISSLAGASLREVIEEWNGLGYNRRAKFLWEAARVITERHGGKLPRAVEELDALPGIGPATAASIAAFAFNEPTVFIETNIRTVFIASFFKNSATVADADIMPYVEVSLDRTRPREWYSALMDYGVMLKRTEGNAGRKSRHYVRQSAFEGSLRQVRGRIVKALLERPCSEKELHALFPDTPVLSLRAALEALMKEGLVRKEKKNFRLV